MSGSMEARYRASLRRYRTAMLNGKPDKVPMRPFVAEFAGKFAGFNCQQVTHDYEIGHKAVCACAKGFDWDAAVGNMVYVWSGLTEALGLRYYAAPGIHVSPEVGFQYLEPSEARANMLPEEYDALIEDPTAFLFNRWLPRVSKDIVAPGEANTYRNQLALVKGGMAMWNYFVALGAQNERLRTECGTAPAIGGILKAPLDILADKLRGYYGLTDDLIEQPEKVRAACEALMPHLLQVALMSADPERLVPVTIWMHRGCVPLITPQQFEEVYWPTLRPILEALWAHGYQVLLYAEGNWDAHLERFAELEERSIIFHVDRSDLKKSHEILGSKFALSGGVSNTTLAVGTPEEVRDACKRAIDIAAGDGGYIMDASAIIQNDAQIANVAAMTEATREYGVYGPDAPDDAPVPPPIAPDPAKLERAMRQFPEMSPKPGVCVPWEVKRPEYSKLEGDEGIVKRVYEEVEAFAYTFVYHCLVSF